MRSLSASVLALVAAGLLTVSCGGIVDPSKNQMESFSGEVAPQGFSSHPFKTDRTGEISIKLTALAPQYNVPLGIIWAGGFERFLRQRHSELDRQSESARHLRSDFQRQLLRARLRPRDLDGT